MKLDWADIAELRPLITEIVAQTVEEIRSAEAKLGEKLGYPEPEAANLLSVPRHVLRDCRLRGEIRARKVGKRFVYSRTALMEFLADGASR